MRYTAREAGHLKAPAVEHVTSEVLSDPEELGATVHAAGRLRRRLAGVRRRRQRRTSARWSSPSRRTTSRTGSSGSGWTTRSSPPSPSIDEAKHKLSLAPAAVAFDGDAENGWTLTINNASPVFPFLKKHLAGRVYMTVSYASEG